MGLKGFNKILISAVVGCALVGCGSVVSNSPFSETATDLGNTTGIKFQAGQIGSASTTDVAYSSIYSQYGQDSNGKYCLRFATAVSGPIESITYVRAAIDGIDDGQDYVLEVDTVYKAVMADGLPTYYNGTAPSTTEGEGQYYWACYTITYNSSKYYNSNVNVSLYINEQLAGTKETSLYEVSNGTLKYNLQVQDGYIGDPAITKAKFDKDEIVGLTSTKLAPEGKQIAGWYDVSNDEILSKDPTSITMPSRDIEVAPYADSTYVEVGSTKDAGLGKLDLNTYLLSTGTIGENTWQSKSTIKPTITPSVINGEGGKLYTLNASEDGQDAVSEGDYVIPLTGYKVTPIDHTFEFTFENKGQEAVSLKVYLVNNSSNAVNVPLDAEEIIIEAGEVKTVETSCSDFSDNNIVPVYYFTSNVTNLKLGAYAYCTYVGEHECFSACQLCGKCKNVECDEAVCAEKCENINPSKSVIVNGGKDFFKASDWESLVASGLGTVRTDAELYNCRGELAFTKNTSSRFDLFYAKTKADGTWGLNIADSGKNYDSNSGTEINNVDHEYTLTMTSTGELDILLFGTKDSNDARNSKNGIYLNIAEDGLVTIYHTSASTNYVSKAEFSGNSTFKTDGTSNTVKFNLIRNSKSKLSIKMTVNGEEVAFTGSSAKSNLFSVSNNYFVTDGVVNNTGYGQRIGIIPLSDSYVTISDLKVNIA